MKARRLRPIGTYLAPERFLAFFAALVLATGLAAREFPLPQAILTGFDIAALIFLVSVTSLLTPRTAEQMRELSRLNDANRAMLLVISGAVIVAILVAVGAELPQQGRLDGYGTALVIATLALAWLFSNTVYALHYAHIYYLPDRAGEHDRGGIDFPGRGEPDYSDFVYFAFTIGMTFQTSDTCITSRAIRRVVVVHGFAAFVFNIGVLAFTVNILGGGRG
ncbi:MAG TPA: DUF1345 domain-containing protein [Sphingomonas sp.]|nr:DUF1345 domain-containing protein [Sphingomonas sp.]